MEDRVNMCIINLMKQYSRNL